MIGNQTKQDWNMMPNTATLYRMVTPESTCPSGVKALALLKQNGFEVDDNHLKSREEIDNFKAKHDVKTTPQIFIDGVRIGGFNDLEAHFGAKSVPSESLSYLPVMMIFAVAALMAIAISKANMNMGGMSMPRASIFHMVMNFLAISMILLGLQKLQDIQKFANMFLTYDLFAQKWPSYAYIYPFIETGAGLLMLAGMLRWVSIPIMLFAGAIGAWSVYKAVYLDKRKLKCACVGGDKNVPLGMVSLIENLMMIAMAMAMLVMI